MTLGEALRHLWPRRLAGQLIALLLLALVISQAVTLTILLDERGHAVRAADRLQVLARTASIVRLLEATPPSLHPQILRTASSPRLRFWLDDESAVDERGEGDRSNGLQRRLRDLLGGEAHRVRVDLRDPDGFWRWRDGGDDDDDDEDQSERAGRPDQDGSEAA